MNILAMILAVILAGGFGYFGAGKLMKQPMMVDAQKHFGMSDGLWQAVGGLEVAGAIGVLVGLLTSLAIIGVLAGIGLVAMTIGAVYYHQRAGDAANAWLPAVGMGAIAILYVIARIAWANA